MAESPQCSRFSPFASALGLLLAVLFLPLGSTTKADIKVDPKKKKDVEARSKFVPTPVAVTVDVVRGQTVDLIVRSPSPQRKRVEFRVREEPTFGKLEGPLVVPNDFNAARFRFVCPADSVADLAVFTVASGFKGEGFSKAIPMRIRIADAQPVLEVTPKLLRLEEIVVHSRSLARKIEIKNTGNSAFRDRLEFPSPWVAVGIAPDGQVEIGPGQTLTMGLRCQPTEAGTHDKLITLQPGIDSSKLQLTALVIQPFAVTPGKLELEWDAGSGTRRGKVAIMNKSDKLMTYTLASDVRLESPRSIEIPPGKSRSLELVLSADDIKAYEGTLVAKAGGIEIPASIIAAPTPARVRIVDPEGGSLDFGTIGIEEKRRLAVTLENRGGTTVPITVRPLPPYSLVGIEEGIEVVGGGRRTIEIEVDGAAVGDPGQVLAILAGTTALRLPASVDINRPKPTDDPPPTPGTVLEINTPKEVSVDEAMKMDGAEIFANARDLPDEVTRRIAFQGLLGRSPFDEHFQDDESLPKMGELRLIRATTSNITFGFPRVPGAKSYVAEIGLVAFNRDNRLLTKIWRAAKRKDLQVRFDESEVEITLRGVPAGEWREVRVFPVFEDEVLGMPCAPVHFSTKTPFQVPWRGIGYGLVALLGLFGILLLRAPELARRLLDPLASRLGQERPRRPAAADREKEFATVLDDRPPRPSEEGERVVPPIPEDTGSSKATPGEVPSL